MVNCLNMFPSKNGISRDLTPASFILGYPNPDHNKLKFALGSYVKVYIGTPNITKQIIVGVIALRPVKEQGGHYFMLLDTGKQLHTYIWTELPINKQVINRVDELATKGKQTDMTKVYPNFEWSPAIPIMDQADSEPENEEASFHSNE